MIPPSIFPGVGGKAWRLRELGGDEEMIEMMPVSYACTGDQPCQDLLLVIDLYSRASLTAMLACGVRSFGLEACLPSVRLWSIDLL